MLKQLKNDENKIILMMDAYEPMGNDRNGASTISSDCNLIDVHTSRHNKAATTATCARGTKKIDYMLITPELLPLIQRRGMLPFYAGIHTDHRGLFIDIDTKYQKEAKKYREEADKETTTSQKSSTTSLTPFSQACYQQKINAKNHRHLRTLTNWQPSIKSYGTGRRSNHIWHWDGTLTISSTA